MRTKHRIIFGDSRELTALKPASIHFVVTSPPYWQLKDYEVEGQIGFGDSYQEYIENLNLVWEECYRVLHPGCRLCVNIGDQFARAIYYGRYKVIPIRTEIIKFCESIGFDYMGAIIWQKVTTCNTSGGATVMGSFPYPRNGILKIDYEFILIFKKLGRSPSPDPVLKEASKLTTDEWNEYFSGHWNFPGVKQDQHLAMFPLELPLRLIKMFTFKGETVLDPFLGSGTTTEAAIRSDRNSVGYEIQENYRGIIERRLSAIKEDIFAPEFDVAYQTAMRPRSSELDERKAKWPFSVNVPELKQETNPKNVRFKSKITLDQSPQENHHKIVQVADCDRIVLDSGEEVRLLGVQVPNEVRTNGPLRTEAISYLEDLTLGQRVALKFDAVNRIDGCLAAYVILQNKTHINAKLIKAGYAKPDESMEYKFRGRFEQYAQVAKNEQLGIWKKDNHVKGMDS